MKPTDPPTTPDFRLSELVVTSIDAERKFILMVWETDKGELVGMEVALDFLATAATPVPPEMRRRIERMENFVAGAEYYSAPESMTRN